MTPGGRIDHLRHLARRFFTSLSPAPPSEGDERWVTENLLPEECLLWQRMGKPDRRHSVAVTRSFVELRPGATRAEIAGAALHDVGKTESGLGSLGRAAATVVGPRGRRFALYHDHESIGARFAAEAGSDPVTVELIGGGGPAIDALRRSDDV